MDKFEAEGSINMVNWEIIQLQTEARQC